MGTSTESATTHWLWRWVWIALALLIVRVTLGVVAGYGDYFPPNFYSEFLTGRQAYFFGAYQVAFWIHIFASPLVMFSGLWLLSGRLRRQYPRVHRRLGRVHTLTVLCLVGPSGLWMSFYALTGWWAGSAFALSSCLVILCAAMGWRAAMLRHFAQHQRWMTRCYLLLCSAIVLRVLSGAATVWGTDEINTYPLFAWISTVGPLLAYETAGSRK